MSNGFFVVGHKKVEVKTYSKEKNKGLIIVVDIQIFHSYITTQYLR